MSYSIQIYGDCLSGIYINGIRHVRKKLKNKKLPLGIININTIGDKNIAFELKIARDEKMNPYYIDEDDTSSYLFQVTIRDKCMYGHYALLYKLGNTFILIDSDFYKGKHSMYKYLKRYFSMFENKKLVSVFEYFDVKSRSLQGRNTHDCSLWVCYFYEIICLNTDPLKKIKEILQLKPSVLKKEFEMYKSYMLQYF